MEYRVTQTKEANIEPATMLALQQYKKVQKLEKRLEEAEKLLAGWVCEIPKKDMGVFVEITTEVSK